MIRKDFEKGGFPLSETAPVLCIARDLQGKLELHMAYTRYDLINILKTYIIQGCYGVWPGKYNTDTFPLDPEAYAAMVVPPEQFKDIDNAEAITVSTRLDGGFAKISYLPKNAEVTIESQNKDLFAYVKKIGLRYTTIFE